MMTSLFSWLRRRRQQGALPVVSHHVWCDTNMPSAAYWAAQGMPIRCNCNDDGPGSMAAVIEAYEQFRRVDFEEQGRLGIWLEPLPPADEVLGDK